MEKIFISGGVPLSGTIPVSGSKNSSLAIMAASLLARRGKTVLHNVPRITDIFTMVDMLQRIGAVVEVEGNNTITIDATDFSVPEAPYELVKRMRASFCVLGPMLARLGMARVPLPGGCDIGARPVDFHVKGLQTLGATVAIDHGYVDAEADDLIGNHIYLDFPSAGATTHLITTAALARGITTIENAAAEPEVIDLARFLTAMGARVEGAGTKKVVIEGVDELRATEHIVIPDRIEAGTYAIASSQPGSEVVLENVVKEHLQAVLAKLEEAGVELTFLSHGSGPDAHGCLRIRSRGRLRAVDILAMPHPGFPTDLQQPMAALLATAEGTAVVIDRVFESRFKFGGELKRMGADVRIEGRSAIIRGVPLLSGAEVVASDLRAGGALIVAGLAAAGETTITGLEHLDRGYEAMVEKLEAVGADIVRYDPDRQPAQLCAV